VAQLDVLQALPLLGRRVDRLRQQGEALDEQRRLAGLGAPERPGGLDDVEGVEVVAEAVEPLVPKVAAAEPELDAAALVLDVGEGQLAHDAAGAHDPADGGHALLALGAPVELLEDGGDRVAALGARRVGLDAGGA
jgi:hypothetical protein